MYKQELIDYIKTQIQKGTHIEQIKQNLATNGWEEKDINSTINYIIQNQRNQQNHEKSEEQYNTFSIIAFALSFFVPIAPLILSIIALKQIKETNEKGKILAQLAFIISLLPILIVFGMIFVITFLLIF